MRLTMSDLIAMEPRRIVLSALWPSVDVGTCRRGLRLSSADRSPSMLASLGCKLIGFSSLEAYCRALECVVPLSCEKSLIMADLVEYSNLSRAMSTEGSDLAEVGSAL